MGRSAESRGPEGTGLVIGHESILAELTSGAKAPRALLFVGPPSVGKWTLAEHVARKWGVPSLSILRISQLTTASARELSSLTNVAASSGRVALVRLDGASPAALNVLLKALEEDSDTTFVLISSEDPASTIRSRCTVYRFGYLTVDQVAEVLRRRNVSPGAALRVAQFSGGRVSKALEELRGEAEVNRVLVRSAVRAVKERDAKTLDVVATNWTDDHTQLLRNFCHEAITRRWSTFKETDVEGIGRKLPLKILSALGMDARPRLVVRAGLMEVLRNGSF